MSNLDLLQPHEVGAQAQFDPQSVRPRFTDIRHVNPRHPDADDDNTGTEEQPWKSIKEAARSLRAGQTAYVHTGTYREDEITPKCAGEPSAPICIMAAPGATVKIEGERQRDASFIVLDKAYWILSNLEIDAKRQKGNAIRISNTNHVVLSRIYAHNGVSGAAIAFDNTMDAALLTSEIHDYTPPKGKDDSHGIVVQPGSQRILIQGNHCYENYADAIQVVGVYDNERHTSSYRPDPRDPKDITIEGNRFHNNYENGVDLKSCQRVTVRGNKLYNYFPVRPDDKVGTALVIHIRSRGALVEHNRIWNCGQAASIGGNTSILGSIVFRRNLIFDMIRKRVRRFDGSEVYSPGNGIRFAYINQQDDSRAEIYHNTLYNIDGDALRLGDEQIIKRAVLVNNIVANSSVSLLVMTRNLPRLTSNNNLFWNSSSRQVKINVNNRNRSLDYWKGLGYDSESISKNPVFVDDPRDNDFYTKDCSPARNAALDTRTGDPTSQVCFNAPDIGFLETCSQHPCESTDMVA